MFSYIDISMSMQPISDWLYNSWVSFPNFFSSTFSLRCVSLLCKDEKLEYEPKSHVSTKEKVKKRASHDELRSHEEILVWCCRLCPQHSCLKDLSSKRFSIIMAFFPFKEKRELKMLHFRKMKQDSPYKALN